MKTTKRIIKFLFILIVLTTISTIADAQNSNKDQQASKMLATKALIDSQRFIFVPQFESPLRGGTRPVTSYYDLEVSRDTIKSYLPYFGRSYTAPLNPSDIG